MSHYESMHPQTETDKSNSTKLVKDYLEGRYRYGRKDIHHLLEIENEVQMDVKLLVN